MTVRIRILSVLGTRPEIIKMAPVVDRLGRATWADSLVCTTAQHRELADQMLSAFGIRSDFDLDIMEHDQPLVSSVTQMLTKLSDVLEQARPDLVLAQGDTNTVLAAGLASFYLGIPFGHIEAGLRTGDFAQPFPEEMNRVVAARLASLHFATTEQARENLLAEGISPDQVFLSGNTVFEALALARYEAARIHPQIPDVPADLLEDVEHGRKNLLLVTAHRRENIGEGLDAVCNSVREFLADHPEAVAVWPVHPNPAVEPHVRKSVGHIARIHLTGPLPYLPFVRLLDLASLILTDSGGVQEEAAALGKPVIVLRRATERSEVLVPGLRELVPPETKPLVIAMQRLWQLDAGRSVEEPLWTGGEPQPEGVSGNRASPAVGLKETLASKIITDIIHDWFFDAKLKD